MSFSEMWVKLQQPEFTTFRLPRKDTGRGHDWHEGEVVQVYYRCRAHERKKLGEAVIVAKEERWVSDIRNDEAKADGFPDGKEEMWRWLLRAHKNLEARTPINKLTLRWLEQGGE